MVRGIANSKIGFGDLILLLRYFFKLKVSTHPNHIDQNPTLKQDLKLLQTIPSIGERSGLLLLGLFHSHKFEKASQAAAYVGLVPVHQLSGSSVNKQSHLSKAGDSKIRSVLYMSALTAIKYNPHIEALYQRLLSQGKIKCVL